MKVDVLTELDVKFKRYRFWSNWVDVCVYHHNCLTYLLQMRVSRINDKRFRAVKVSRMFSVTGPDLRQIGDLTQMKKID